MLINIMQTEKGERNENTSFAYRESHLHIEKAFFFLFSSTGEQQESILFQMRKWTESIKEQKK